MKTARKKWGTNVAQPRPFTVFPVDGTVVGVRIARCKPFLRAREVVVSASPVTITATPDGPRITGEGVVRRHGDTIAVTP